MRVCNSADTKIFVAFVLTSPLRQADEEALVRRETVTILQGLTCGCSLPRNVGEDGAAEISHVFAFCEFAVDLDVIHYGVLCVLVHHTFGALFKVLSVFFSPPVTQ